MKDKIKSWWQIILNYEADISLVLIFLFSISASFMSGLLINRSSTLPPTIYAEPLPTVNQVKQGDTTANKLAPQPAEVGESAQYNSLQVVASKNSDKYHYPWCSGANRIKDENKIYFANPAQAEAAGYQLAGNCK